MRRSTCTILAYALAASAACPAVAQEGDSAPDEAPAEPSESPASDGESFVSRFSLDVSLRYTSDYFFRGIAQKTGSFNLQPSVELGFELLETDDFRLSLLGGSWSNFSDDRADGASGSFRERWYEHDAYVGLSAGVDRLTLGAIYTWYMSPSSDFTEYEDLTLSLSFDDSEMWDEAGRFSLNPGLALAIETRNAASGPDSGVWLGLGLEPTIAIGESELGPVTLSFPIAVGLSLHDYYQLSDGDSSTYGFTEIGLTLSLDMGQRFGSAAPTLDVGVSYLMLGGVLEDLNDDDSDEVIFTVGLAWSF